MGTHRDPEVLLTAARLYYLQNRSQAEIASELQTSRPNVSRILREAVERGMVEIRIKDPRQRVPSLETALRKRFDLTDVRVARTPPASTSRIAGQVGVLASELLVELLDDEMTVALSWGHALQAMVKATGLPRPYDVTLAQLVGGLSPINNDVSGAELVRELATRLGGDYVALHAPATLGSSSSRDALLEEPPIAHALDVATSADLAFVGVGSPTTGSSSAVLASLALSRAEEKAFWQLKPVGDVAARYFDESGQECAGPVADRVLSISLPDLVAIPRVVGVAFGEPKVASVLGALRGALIDSLVCDEVLARSLLARGEEARVRSALVPS